MNVRIVPRGWPDRTDLYSGIPPKGVLVSHGVLTLLSYSGTVVTRLPMHTVAEILLDEDGADP